MKRFLKNRPKKRQLSTEPQVGKRCSMIVEGRENLTRPFVFFSPSRRL